MSLVVRLRGRHTDFSITRPVLRLCLTASTPPIQGTPLLDGEGADAAKFSQAVKTADMLGDKIAKITDKIMDMRKDIDEKQVCFRTPDVGPE